MRNELSMNNNTIILNKYRFLLAILLITIIASISPLTSFAQEETRERGWNGRIIKAELLQILLNLKEDEFVAGYIINGSDIIEIIEESDIDIRIKNSVIEGGLDFTNLPVVDQRIEVNNKISIKNSEIGFWQAGNSKYSLYSGKTLFNKLISFRETQFCGEADFIKAQFSGKSSFYNAQFSEEADFGGAQFSGSADFREAQFSGKSSFYNAQLVRKHSSREPNSVRKQTSGKPNSVLKRISLKPNSAREQISGKPNSAGEQTLVKLNSGGKHPSIKPNSVWKQTSGKPNSVG